MRHAPDPVPVDRPVERIPAAGFAHWRLVERSGKASGRHRLQHAGVSGPGHGHERPGAAVDASRYNEASQSWCSPVENAHEAGGRALGARLDADRAAPFVVDRQEVGPWPFQAGCYGVDLAKMRAAGLLQPAAGDQVGAVQGGPRYMTGRAIQQGVREVFESKQGCHREVRAGLYNRYRAQWSADTGRNLEGFGLHDLCNSGRGQPYHCRHTIRALRLTYQHISTIVRPHAVATPSRKRRCPRLIAGSGR